MTTDGLGEGPRTGVDLEQGALATPANATCQWQDSLGRHSCLRILDGIHPTLCILHDPNPDKDQEGQFRRALEDKIKADEESEAILINLSGVIFPTNADFSQRVFKKGISFEDANFMGNVNFVGTQFDGRVIFSDAWFRKEAAFAHAKFMEGTDFWGTRFFSISVFIYTQFIGEVHFRSTQFIRNAYFTLAQFTGQVNYSGAQFKREAYFARATVNGSLTFQSQTFLAAADSSIVVFSDLTSESARRIRFEGVNLSRVSFLRTDVSQMRFVGCTWARKNSRNVVHDEMSLDKASSSSDLESPTPQLVSDLYRQLRLNYESDRQEVEAGDFYIGQMEMRRQDKSYPLFYRLLLSIYRITGMYGESYVRPFTWYAFILAPLYALGYWILSDLSFADGLFSALTAGFLFREVPEGIEDWEKLLVYFNMFTVIYLLGLTILALRRHFRR